MSSPTRYRNFEIDRRVGAHGFTYAQIGGEHVGHEDTEYLCCVAIDDFHTEQLWPAAACPYCGTANDLRIASQDPWGGHREYICAGCFTGSDTGPCFDDLPRAERRPEA